MLFVSVGQGWIFLILLIAGVWCALIELLLIKILKFAKLKINLKEQNKEINKKNTKKSISFINKKQQNIKNQKSKTNFKNFFSAMIYCFKILIYGTIIYLIVYFLDYGNLRFYHILGFCVGFYITKYFFVNLKQKITLKWYNRFGGLKNEKDNVK